MRKRLARFAVEWSPWIGIAVIATPIMFRCAYAERGYRAIGGEALTPVVVMELGYIVKTIRRELVDIIRNNADRDNDGED